MPGPVIVNRHGATQAELNYAKSILSAIDQEYGLDEFAPKHDGNFNRKEYHAGASRLRDEIIQRQPQAERRLRNKGMMVNYNERTLAVFEDVFPRFDAVTWLEDNRHIGVQIYPPRGRTYFGNFPLLLDQSNRCAARVFINKCNTIKAEYYSGRRHHKVALVHDRSRRGYDMIHLMFIGLNDRVDSVDLLVDYLKLLADRIRQGPERGDVPLELRLYGG